MKKNQNNNEEEKTENIKEEKDEQQKNSPVKLQKTVLTHLALKFSFPEASDNKIACIVK